MLSALLREHYGITDDLALLYSHFGTEIFRCGQYIVKTLPPRAGDLENEGRVTDFLLARGIPVAKLLKTNQGAYQVRASDMKFHVQAFIEGETPAVNTAPDWMLEKTADLLGRIHLVLDGYTPMKINFGTDFFRKSRARNAGRNYAKKLREAKKHGDATLISELEERVKHLKRIAAFRIDARKLTYRNSHGDFHIGQVIVNGRGVTVIDWTTACRLPACLEVIRSYVTAAPACASGGIDSEGLKRYIRQYAKHVPLSEYDLKMMPYVLYFQQILCHYSPPYSNIAETYQPHFELINQIMRWLYDHAEELSSQLSKEEKHA